jgi:ABC-type branched-subunit amino acid transport system ATPase component
MSIALEASGVTVQFGGLRALSDVEVKVGADEIVGLIGGNGAGKTTFMDCVSGYVQPEAGASILAFGEQLVGLPPEMRPFLDVGRSYQSARLFPGLTVTESLLVAVERHNPTNVLSAVLGLSSARAAEAAKRARVDELIAATGLGVYREKLVGELSTGTRRVVDLASILAQQPKLLLLDEPTAGLAQRETEAFGPLIGRVKEQLGCAVLIIEHDMVLIGELCDRVYALESGRVIAEGTPDVVRNDPKVVASYLGTDEAAINRSGAITPKRRARREPLRAS